MRSERSGGVLVIGGDGVNAGSGTDSALVAHGVVGLLDGLPEFPTTGEGVASAGNRHQTRRLVSDGCQSGRLGTPGKRVYRKVPRVRIPPHPPDPFVIVLVVVLVLDFKELPNSRESSSQPDSAIRSIRYCRSAGSSVKPMARCQALRASASFPSECRR